MQKKFLTNLGLLLFLNLLVKPFWIFGIDRTVQNTVGASQYGFYFTVLNFSFLFNILLDLGITNFNNRNIAQNNHLLNKHFSGIISIKFFLAAVYFVVAFTMALVLKYNGAQMMLLVFLGFNQFLSSLILYLRSNVSGLLMFKTDSFLSVMDRILMILFCGVLLWGNVTHGPFRIEWFVYSQTAAYLLTMALALYIVVKKANFRRPRFSWPFFMMILKQSFPFAMLVLLMTFYNRLDPVMLEKILGDARGNEQVGVYASGFRLLDAANMIAFLFSVLLIPIFSKMIKNGESVEQMVKLSFTLIMTTAIIVAAGSFFYSYQLMDLLYDAHIAPSAAVFRLLMCGFVAVSTSYIFGTLLTAHGSLKQLNIIAFIGLAVNLSFNLWLIPRHLALGSAWSSLTTQFFVATAQIVIAQRIFRFRINYRFLATLLAYAAGVVFFNFVSRQMTIPVPGLPGKYAWMPNFTLAILFSFLLAVALRLLSFKSLLNILRSER